MSELKVSEAGSVQFPMVRHAVEIGWAPLTPDEAADKRGGEKGLFLYDELRAALLKLNPGLVSEENMQEVIDRLEAIGPTIEGNRQFLEWLRGKSQIRNEGEDRAEPVRLIDFENPEANTYHVTWEWRHRPIAAGRKANRADVIFLINGVPVCIVEHKNPKLRDAIEIAVGQLKRYQVETPELIASAQVFNATHLVDYWYGVTWNASRRFVARWKDKPDETYRFAVQSFFDRPAFLHMLEEWVLFYEDDGELKKSVLRQHQTRAVDAILKRCADPKKKRGLIWHTQGSGKTFTLLTAARLMLEDRDRFREATAILIVDRIELEGQLKGWVDRILGEMQGAGIAIERANSKADLQRLLKQDFRGLIVSMIHKFDEIAKDSNTRENIYVLIDEAHRSVGGPNLGTYMMAAIPNATLIGFTGTPIDKTATGGGTFKVFGGGDPGGYLDKYSIRESIEDETTLPIKHTFAPSEMLAPLETLDREFLSYAEAEGVTDIDELNRVLERAVDLRAFLTADDRVEKVAAFVAKHFQESVRPLGYKAFVVGVNREACAKYKVALDKHLPPEMSAVIYSANAADAIDRPLVARLQPTDAQEEDIRKRFKKADKEPQILIVTDKLLTGYDAPVLYVMYLDKPMRDHVLLQALARVNRPYVDAKGISKKVGLVVDFVGVLKELKKALKFDSEDVNGVIEDLDKLMGDFKTRMSGQAKAYLEAGEGGWADEKLEAVLGKFTDTEARQAFYDFYRDVEALWEVLAPDPELRDHIEGFNRLADLYAIVRNAFDARSVSFLDELEYKTRRLVQENAQQHGLGRLTRSITFDLATLDALIAKPGDDKGKVVNFVRAIVADAGKNAHAAPHLIPLKERAENVLKGLEERTVTGLAALDMLREIAKEKDAAEAERTKLELSPKAFAALWSIKGEANIGVDLALDVAREADRLMGRFPNFIDNPEERRQLRSSLYRPLLSVDGETRTRVVDAVIAALVGDVS